MSDIDAVLEQIAMQLEKVIGFIIDDMRMRKFSEAFIQDFICIRFHQAHAWGVGNCIFNGNTIPCIGVQDPGENKVRVAFVAFHPDMKLLDERGIAIASDALVENAKNARTIN